MERPPLGLADHRRRRALPRLRLVCHLELSLKRAGHEAGLGERKEKLLRPARLLRSPSLRLGDRETDVLVLIAALLDLHLHLVVVAAGIVRIVALVLLALEADARLGVLPEQRLDEIGSILHGKPRLVLRARRAHSVWAREKVDADFVQPVDPAAGLAGPGRAADEAREHGRAAAGLGRGETQKAEGGLVVGRRSAGFEVRLDGRDGVGEERAVLVVVAHVDGWKRTGLVTGQSVRLRPSKQGRGDSQCNESLVGEVGEVGTWGFCGMLLRARVL